MNSDKARMLVQEALREAAPRAALVRVSGDVRLDKAYHLDEAHMVAVARELARQTGLPIDDDDVGALETLDGATEFLIRESARLRLIGLR